MSRSLEQIASKRKIKIHESFAEYLLADSGRLHAPIRLIGRPSIRSTMQNSGAQLMKRLRLQSLSALTRFAESKRSRSEQRILLSNGWTKFVRSSPLMSPRPQLQIFTIHSVISVYGRTKSHSHSSRSSPGTSNGFWRPKDMGPCPRRPIEGQPGLSTFFSGKRNPSYS